MGGGFQREVFIADLELKKLPFSCIHLTTVPLCGLVVEIVRVFTQPPFIRVAGQQQEQTRQTRNTISDGLPPSPFANSVHPLLQSLALLLPAPDRERERGRGLGGGRGRRKGENMRKRAHQPPSVPLKISSSFFSWWLGGLSLRKSSSSLLPAVLKTRRGGKPCAWNDFGTERGELIPRFVPDCDNLTRAQVNYLFARLPIVRCLHPSFVRLSGSSNITLS